MKNRVVVDDEEVTATLDPCVYVAGLNSFMGIIHEDRRERWEDGRTILTSSVKEVFDSMGETYAQTRNSLYRLRNRKDEDHTLYDRLLASFCGSKF